MEIKENNDQTFIVSLRSEYTTGIINLRNQGPIITQIMGRSSRVSLQANFNNWLLNLKNYKALIHGK